LPNRVLELAGHALAAQVGLQAAAVEAAVLLQLGQAGDRIDQVGVGHVDAEACGLVAQERLLDQLVERLTGQVEAAQEVRPAAQLAEGLRVCKPAPPLKFPLPRADVSGSSLIAPADGPAIEGRGAARCFSTPFLDSSRTIWPSTSGRRTPSST